VKTKYWVDRSVHWLLLACAGVSVLALAFITGFIFQKGLPLFARVPPGEFLFSARWEPTEAADPGFGILAFVAGSMLVTLLALAFSVLVGVGCAVFIAELASARAARFLRSVGELLAGIPSVVYGFFGVVVVCSLVRTVFGGTGYSVLSGAIILAIMILPTIVNISEAAIRAVPREYKEGSLAIGATHWQSIRRVILPSARSGIIAAIVLGAGRAIGETMAVLMVAGNAPVLPRGLLSMTRTLTMNIITDMGYASGDHLTSLFTTSIVLFLFIVSLNIAINLLARQGFRRAR